MEWGERKSSEQEGAYLGWTLKASPQPMPIHSLESCSRTKLAHSARAVCSPSLHSLPLLLGPLFHELQGSVCLNLKPFAMPASRDTTSGRHPDLRGVFGINMLTLKGIGRRSYGILQSTQHN